MREPQLKSVMTPFPHSIDEAESIRKASEMMATHEIRHLPVTSEGELIGVVSDRDLLLGSELSSEEAAAVRIADVCTREPLVAGLHDPLHRVLLEMAERHVGSALVTSHGNLAGILTATDACRAFGEHIREQFNLDNDGNAA